MRWLALLLGAGLALSCRTPAVRPVAPPAAPGAAVGFPAAELPDPLAEAERLLGAGRPEEAGSLAEPLTHAESTPGYAQALLIMARVAQARAERERAVLYLEKLLSTEQQPLLYPAHLARADLAFQAKDFEGAYRHYLAAVNAAGSDAAVPSAVWLRLTHIAHYENHDPERAGYFFRLVSPADLSQADRELWDRLGRRLAWRALSAEAIGLGDGNVSALRVDGDDLWVGTWNGGVARYSLSDGRTQVFRAGRESIVPGTVRCIEVTPARVWVGTYQGLFVYSKATSSWQEVAAFSGSEPWKVEAIAAADGRLFVGTLGEGLWRQEGDGWQRIEAGVLPGDFITCLQPAGGQLLLGTLSRGVLLFDLARQSLASFDALAPGLEARNITMLLADPPDSFWIGTYGQGVYRWDGATRRLSHFTRAGGSLGDDWVLCGARTRSGLYFGTLGGGLSRYDGRSWQTLGREQGVAARDISALAYSSPYLYLGTLGAGITILSEGSP